MFIPTNPYIALSDLVQELKMKPAEVAADPNLVDELNDAIDRASRWVEEYTQRDWALHDQSVIPLVFDQFTENVFDREIFVPTKPIVSISKVVMGDTTVAYQAGSPGFTGNGTELILNSDIYFNESRIFLLPSSRLFIMTVDMPRDGSAALGRRDYGWSLFRPTRILYVWGKFGYDQPYIYTMTVSGDTGNQTSNWKISGATSTSTFYWKLTATGGVATIAVYGDSAFTQLLAQASAPATGAQTVQLVAQNNSGINGSVSFNYASDDTDAGNVLVPTPSQTPAVDSAQVPAGIPGKISIATRLVAAAFSGHNRKEVVGLDGSKTALINNEIPKTVYQVLGRRMPLLV